jgi:hypothetical protein
MVFLKKFFGLTDERSLEKGDPLCEGIRFADRIAFYQRN